MTVTNKTRLPSLPLAALAGVAASSLGLAVAEVVVATSKNFQSPVISVGDRVIDLVPAWLKNLAIDWFGTNDKIALLAGIGSVLLAYAAIVGILALRRNMKVGLAGIALFGLLGSLAALGARTGGDLLDIVPSVVGAGVAGIALVGIARLSKTNSEATTDSASGPDRRRFLGLVGGAAIGAAFLGALGRRFQSRFSAAESRQAIGAFRVADPIADPPSGIYAPIDGIKPFFTPNDDFYRIDTAITVPQVPAESWTLKIDGMVDQPMEITYDELINRPLIERDITLTCVSNEIGGSLLGTARWVGVRLDDLLAEAGIDPQADQIVGRSVDGFTAGFPVATLDGRDAIVAVAMNGEPLPLEHGFPARLVVPGLYGYVSATKWLTELELTRFDRFDAYWVPRGWDALGPIKTQSRIDTPRSLSKPKPGPVAIGGTAWAQTRGIAKVEIQVDDGDWVETTLAEELNDVTWRQWSTIWEATPGRHLIKVRATDKFGAIQTPDRSEPMPNGATGQHEIVVLVSET